MREIRRSTFDKTLTAAACATLVAAWASPARAQAPVPDEPGPSQPAERAAPAAPIGVSGSLGNSLVLRGNPSETTLISVLSGSYQWTSAVSTFARIGSVHNTSSDVASGTVLGNPALGASAQFALGKHVKVGGLSGLTLPIGSGGGNAAAPSALRAWANSIDWGGAMFAVDHVDVFNGLRGSYEYGPVTLQLESTLHELLRVRGAAVDPIGSSATVTSTTATVTYALPMVSVSTALSETRFWNTPKCIALSPDSRADYFVIAGASTTVKIGGTELNPGLVYARALDLPLSREKFQVVELDLGFAL